MTADHFAGPQYPHATQLPPLHGPDAAHASANRRGPQPATDITDTTTWGVLPATASATEWGPRIPAAWDALPATDSTAAGSAALACRAATSLGAPSAARAAAATAAVRSTTTSASAAGLAASARRAATSARSQPWGTRTPPE